jgi:hypothetical protein
VYGVGDVGLWLWKRFVGDAARAYGTLEQANVAALLATGMDLGFAIDAGTPDTAYSVAELEHEPLSSAVASFQKATIDLGSPTTATRRKANHRVGMAINFITMTPAMFATEGTPISRGPVLPTPIHPDVEPAQFNGLILAVDTAGLPKAIVVDGLTVWITSETAIQYQDSSGGNELIPGQSAAGTAVENTDGSYTAVDLQIS